MTIKESERVEKVIRSIYATVHGCALKTGKEIKNGKKGQLCDVCEDAVTNAIKYIKE